MLISTASPTCAEQVKGYLKIRPWLNRGKGHTTFHHDLTWLIIFRKIYLNTQDFT